MEKVIYVREYPEGIFFKFKNTRIFIGQYKETKNYYIQQQSLLLQKVPQKIVSKVNDSQCGTLIAGHGWIFCQRIELKRENLEAIIQYIKTFGLPITPKENKQ